MIIQDNLPLDFITFVITSLLYFREGATVIVSLLHLISNLICLHALWFIFPNNLHRLYNVLFKFFGGHTLLSVNFVFVPLSLFYIKDKGYAIKWLHSTIRKNVAFTEATKPPTRDPIFSLNCVKTLTIATMVLRGIIPVGPL